MDKNVISGIDESRLDKGSISKIVYFTENMSAKGLAMLFNGFNLTTEDVDFFIKNYRNIGMIFKLKRENQEFNGNLDGFIYTFFPNKKPSSKFDNTFFSKDYDKVLLVSNKRLLEVDLGKLNEKIDMMHDKITENNLILERERIFLSKFQNNRILETVKRFLSK